MQVPVPVKAYKLLEGKQHMHDGVDLKPGDIVLFNVNQANAFKDKFVAVDASKFKVLSPEEEKTFVEKEANRRFERDQKPATAEAFEKPSKK
jgi:hypothetical protein